MSYRQVGMLFAIVLLFIFGCVQPSQNTTSPVPVPVPPPQSPSSTNVTVVPNTTEPVPLNVMPAVVSPFGSMLAYNINDFSANGAGKLQNGWSEFRKDASSYQALKNAVSLGLQERTTIIKKSGFSVDREIAAYFTWNVIEPEKGQFDWNLTDLVVQAADDSGVKLTAVVQPFAAWDQKNTKTNPNCKALDFAYYDYKAGAPNDWEEYKNFITKMVERYKGKITYWEIGNEVEGACGGFDGNPEGYVKLLNVSFETIKNADSKAKVLNGGALETSGTKEAEATKSFWKKFFGLGGWQYLDYFNIHYNTERSSVGGAKSDSLSFLGQLNFFNDLMEKNGGKKPIWITEFGTYSGTPVSPFQSQVSGGSQPSDVAIDNSPSQTHDVRNDAIYFSSSADGKTWPNGTLIRNSASVPDVIQLSQDVGKFKKGELLVYFVDFSSVAGSGLESLGIISSNDGGATWKDEGNMVLSGKVNAGAAVDPSIVQLSNGTLRLYFFGSEITSGDPALVEGPHKVYSALSSDGIDFIVEPGIRFQANSLTDPEVIQYGGKWFMYYSTGTSASLAVASDGLSFSGQTISGGNIGGVPGALPINGGVRLFACGSGGLASAFASEGISFKKEQNDVFNGKAGGTCDPSVFASDNGNYLLVYKVNGGSQQSSTQQPSTDTTPSQTKTVAQSQEFQAAWYFRNSIIGFANGANRIFIDLVGRDNDIIGGSAAFNPNGQERLFVTTLQAISAKIGWFSKVEKIAEGQYGFTVSDKIVYALWNGTPPKELVGMVKITDFEGQEKTVDSSQLKLQPDKPVFVELLPT